MTVRRDYENRDPATMSEPRSERVVSRDEFERAYADQSGVTVEWLHVNKLFAEPCDCDYEGCKGWVMTTLYPRVAKESFDV